MSFVIGRSIELTSIMPGLVAMAIFFGAGAIQAITLPLERRTGTFKMLLTAPTTLFTITMGKILAGFFFGIILSIVYVIIMLPLSPVLNLPLYFIGISFSSLFFSVFGLFLSTPFRDIPQAMPPATVVRISMVFLCGVFTPLETMPIFLQTIAYLLPLTYSVDALKQATNIPINIQMFLIDLGILFFYSIIFLIATIKVLERTIE
ncbi:MAG: ABC transporter permease [Candidatus Helarchaeota archaeon]|nr:ABC transporter permease [Candidatus Helarchaeota archaeon]